MAVKGIVDFRDADIMDVNWWRRSHILLRELAAAEDRDILQVYYRRQCAMLSRPTDSELSKKIFEATEATQHDLVRSYKPWIGTAEDSQKKAYKTLIESYTETFGRPDDPVFKQRIADGLAAYDEYKRGRKQVPETEDEQLTRRMLEHQAAEKHRLHRRRQ